MLPYYVAMNNMARGVALTAGIALCYFLLGKLGLESALPPGFVSAIWPAAGFAFAITVLRGVRATALGIFAGSLVTNATVGGGFHIDTVAACIAVGSTVQAAVGGTALKRLMPQLELNDPRTVMRFSLLGVASCLIAASIGNLTLIANGYIAWEQLPLSFATWWLGDAFGVQIFAPLTLVALAPSAVWKQRRISVGLPLLVAFMLSGVIYLYVRESDERQLQRDFAAAIAPFEHELRSLEQTNGQALRQLAASYRLRGEAPGAEFTQVAAEIDKSLPGLQTISWIPALGVDLMGEPKRAAALRMALASDQLTMTSVMHLAQDPDGPGAVLLMAPISNAAAKGVVAGVINLRMVDKALQSTPGVVWELREVAAGGVGEQTMWKSSKLVMPEFADTLFWTAWVSTASSA